MAGVFNLRNPDDLLKKLEWDYEALMGDQGNSYLAFNFFVTAWHMLEWVYPDPDSERKRTELRTDNVILAVCDDLAVGAKHFKPTGKKHDSVKATRKTGIWGDKVWAPGAWAKGAWAEWLEVALSGEAAEQYGSVVKAHDLASHAIEFWREFDFPS